MAVRDSMDTGIMTAVVLSLVSLFLSALAVVLTLDDDADVRDVERRLACLELPGANDCGADSR
jgi:hypothetical protein